MAALQIHTQSAPNQAAHLANTVGAALKAHLSVHPRVRLALSGGRSPVAFLQALACLYLPWHRVDVALVDERLTADKTCRNADLIRRYFLRKAAGAACFYPLLDKKLDCEDASAQLAAANLAYRQPDIVVLGMGLDGHFASLFAAGDFKNAAPVVQTRAPVAPVARLSLAFESICAAQHLFLSIQGAQKWAVLERARHGDAELPISRLLAADVALKVFYES